MLYSYTKDPNYHSVVPGYNPNSKRISGFLSIVFLFVGLVLVGQVIYPIFSWYIFTLPIYSQKIITPLASNFFPANISNLPSIVRASDISPTVSLYANNNSYQPSSWFPQARPFSQAFNSDLRVYTVSIPKLKIDNATVEIGGDNLKKSLIAWPTSAIPGNYGVNIIFGHSELPQFANPTDYSGIFTHIMDLESGAVILVDYDGVRYKYIVSDKKVVDPDDLSVLEQRFDDRYLILITCVPPGTLWKRGVVKARMAQL